MGQNKAFLNFRGQTLLARALQMLGEVSLEVTIVGDPEIFSRYGRVISDVFPNCGPLGGIHAALMHTSADLNLVLAVDMPFATAHLLKFLIDEAAKNDAMVTLPCTARGLQPLCAVYRPAFGPIAEQALRARKYKIDAAFTGIPIREITGQELSAAGLSESNFFNINTPEDRRAAAHLKP